MAKARRESSTGGQPASPKGFLVIERVQTGVRIERRILKVLKALAELHDVTLGDLLEGIVLHVFEGKLPFGKDSLRKIEELRRIYRLDLDASASHRMTDRKRRDEGLIG